jgi:hypothetical protein
MKTDWLKLFRETVEVCPANYTKHRLWENAKFSKLEQVVSAVITKPKMVKLRGLSPQANYTDRATAAVGEVVPTFAGRGV